MVLLTAILFIGLLLALVLVHEWGHFIAAKKAGCNVEEFGFGFPPRLFSRMWHGTKYSFNLLPIGGFVKIEGENMDEANPAQTSFAAKSAPWRITILAAGVAMNMVLAVGLLTVQSGLGSPSVVTEGNAASLVDLHTYIVDIAANSPAKEAGVQAFDRIVSIEGEGSPSIATVQQVTNEHKGGQVTIEIERAGEHKTLEITARANPPEGEGSLGVSLAATGLAKTSWWMAPVVGINRTWQMTGAIVQGFSTLAQQLISGQSLGGSVTGPIGIAVYTNEAAKLGPSYFLEFAAMISINLALINILPLPALDGGRILFVLFEVVFRRRIPGKFEGWAHAAGFALLIGLMVLITLKDVKHYF
ncbi:MAG: RIP metalloprotease RseP [Candidatus Andersenbacteria bacterium]|nr:RIP metalloprotease RseP [Candidatus Andersenbacteria bacterium]